MMRKYYNLTPSINSNESGNVYPPIESYEDYDFNGFRSIHKLTFREFPDFDPDIRFRLVKGAKLCDVMGQATISAYGLIISENAKKVFSKIKIAPHKFYPCHIEDPSKKVHNYYWMHIVWNDIPNFISYQKSSFYKRKFTKNLGELTIESDNQFWKVKEEIGSRFLIGINKIHFKDNLPFELFPYPYSSKILIVDSAINKIHSLSGIDICYDDSISGGLSENLNH